MWPYWMLFALPASFALREAPRASGGQPHRKGTVDRRLVAFGLLLTLMIGQRVSVGADWGNYLGHMETAHETPLAELLEKWEPGYAIVCSLSDALDWGVFGVNTIVAAIFSFGLVRFCSSLPYPWLAMTSAVPYLAIVVAMGYTRQGAAIGFEMLALLALQRNRVVPFALLILAAASFHRSAVVLLPLPILLPGRRRLFGALWGVGSAVVGFRWLLADSIDSLRENYIEAEYNSAGSLIRLLMNALAGLLHLTRWRSSPGAAHVTRGHWDALAAASFALLVAYQLSPSSTAVDRIGLYVLPLQIFAFGTVRGTFASIEASGAVLLAVVLYCAAVQFTWLTFAVHAFAWIPYRFNLLE